MTTTKQTLEKQIQYIDARLDDKKTTRSIHTELINRRAILVERLARLEAPTLEKLKKAARPRPASRKARTKSNAGRKRSLSAAEITSIRKTYPGGRVSMRELAKKHGVSVSTIHEYLKGIPTKKTNTRYEIEKDQVGLVVNMYRHMTMAAIAKKFGVSETTIWRAIRLRAKVKVKYKRKRSERRERKARAAIQPNMHIDRRLSARKRKRGVKHENEGRVQIVRGVTTDSQDAEKLYRLTDPDHKIRTRTRYDDE